MDKPTDSLGHDGQDEPQTIEWLFCADPAIVIFHSIKQSANWFSPSAGKERRAVGRSVQGLRYVAGIFSNLLRCLPQLLSSSPSITQDSGVCAVVKCELENWNSIRRAFDGAILAHRMAQS